MCKPAYLLDVNVMKNIYILEELIVSSKADIIAKSHCVEDPTWPFFLLNILKTSASMHYNVHTFS